MSVFRIPTRGASRVPGGRALAAAVAAAAVAVPVLGPPPAAAAPVGSFPLTVENRTGGAWSDDRIYLTVMGQSSPGEWAYLRTDGTLDHIDHDDENAPGHLTKNGRNYADMSFTLAEAPTVNIPPRIEGARLYVSLGEPMYFPIAPDDSGWGGPDFNNPNDPNTDVHFDWYEFTYRYGVTNFGGNTTQVDMFGFPLTARLTQAASGYDVTRGITAGRDEVRAAYAATVSQPFRGLVDPHRIVAPRSSPDFRPGGAHGDHLGAYIDTVWNSWAGGFTLSLPGRTFTGRLVNGRLEFTKNGTGPYHLDKPTSGDVFSCSGALASPGMAPVELELGAQVCAAFNRGVAQDTTDWWNSGLYYDGPTDNEYAGFFHGVGIDGRAYGFPYDDVNDRSTVAILPNAQPPTSLTIGVGW